MSDTCKAADRVATGATCHHGLKSAALRSFVVATAIFLAVTWHASVRAASAADVWLYLGFDTVAEQVHPSYGFRLVRKGEGAPLLPGRVGNAIRLDRENSAFVSVLSGGEPFPSAEGAVVLWLKPDAPLGSGNQWLVFGNWASFELHVEGDRLFAYASPNSREALIGSLSKFRSSWTERWHMIVLTWAGSQRRLFVDGELVAARDDASPMTQTPANLHLGYLPAALDQPDRAHFVGAFDEFGVLQVALTPQDVAYLYRLGTRKVSRGLLQALGGDVVVWTDRHGLLRGETVTVSVAPQVSGAKLRLEAVSLDGQGAAPVVLWEGRPATRAFELDTRDLRPGAFKLRATVLSSRGNPVIPANDRTTVRILAQRSPDFPVGLDGLVGYPDKVLDQVSSWGLSFVSSGVYPKENLKPETDRLFFHGLGYFPNLNVHDHRIMALDKSRYFDASGKGNQRLRDEVLQGLVLHGDGSFASYSTSLGSPFSPVAREAMRTHVRRYVEAAEGHPGLLAVSFDDEYEFRIGTDKASGLRYYGDYSAAARKYFQSVTGLPPVFPPVVSPGSVLPDSHPYFLWRDVIGMPGDPSAAGLEESWADLAAVVHETRADVKATTWSGGESGQLDAVMDYGYPAIWQPRPEYLNGHGRMDFLFDRHRARQRAEDQKPVWALLGWWSEDLRGQPAWIVEDFRLNNALALAKGATLINWHSSWAKPKDPELMGTGLLSRQDTMEEMARWARLLREQGPMYARLISRRDGRVAVLLSDDDRVGKLQTHNQALAYNWFYPAIRLAGYPVDIVTDEMVESGEVGQYAALLLGDFDFASASLWSAIEAYARTPGKTVFADTGTTLRPAGTVPLPFHVLQSGDPHGRHPQHEMQPLGWMVWMSNILRESMTSRVGASPVSVSGSSYVAPFFLYGGSGRLLTLVNYHLDEAQSVLVTVTSDGPTYVYDVESGQQVAQAAAAGRALRWRAAVPNAGAARYVLLRQSIAGVQASVSEDAGDFVVRASVIGGDGSVLRFPLPLRVTMIDPLRRPVPAYTQYTAPDPQTGTLELRFPRSRLMDGTGHWDVSVRELVTGIENQPAP